MQIILADDEFLARYSIQSVLEQIAKEKFFQTMWGAIPDYIQVQSGRELIDAIQLVTPELVFLDIQMPGISGLDAMENLVRKNSGIKWIILSGYPDFDYAKKAIRLGASAYLLKPVNPDEVRETLQQLHTSMRQEKSGLFRTMNLQEEDSEANNTPILVRRALAVSGRLSRLPIGVAQIAEEMGVSPNYLSTEFKKSQGISLTTYLTLLRLNEARRLLREPGMTVKRVAESVGYQGGRHFARVFRERYGISPSKFQQIVEHDSYS